MRGRRLLAVTLGAGALWLVVPAGVAQAHPLGNFTVNHADDLQLSPDGVVLTSVVDRAEIPTAQELQSIAPDGAPTDAQLADAATAECPLVAAAVRASVGDRALDWQQRDAAMVLVPGAGGLPTLRLTCTFAAEADLRSATALEVRDDYLDDRVGWREMTADGDGVRLVDSPVPTQSSTDQLRTYPVDLLASPADVRGFTVATEPGTNSGAGAPLATAGGGDPFTDAVAALDRRFEDLAGGRELTPLVGGLAVVLAVLLGCGHALLPGHGKSVMAAYLAGRRGRSRDAVVVGATVTATHTVGVLVLGAAITVSSSLAGDQVLRWLGVASGLLVAGIGATMLRGAVPRWRAARSVRIPLEQALPEPSLAAAVHAHGSAAHVHPHPDHGDHGHHHDDHGHGHHDHGHPHHDHDHDHDHDHHHDHHDHDHGGWWSGGHSHGPGGHSHGPGKGGLIGMGVAGGLVPSPSALIVLLASIGLGRTVFGVVLVLAYGLGMAGTLTAVGLLLVRLRGRLERRLSDLRRARLLGRITLALPVSTAVLVLLVGLSLVVRGVVLGA